MIRDLQQTELDLVEKKILTEIFGGYEPQNLVFRHKLFKLDVSADVQRYIDKFEAFIKPFMDEQGYVDGAEIKKHLADEVAKFIPAEKFRLIDIYDVAAQFVVKFIKG